jgi:protein O-GlcNAc transferase
MAAIADILNQGLHYHQAGNWKQAEQLYRSALKLDPQNADAYHLLGVLAHQVGDSDAALVNLTQAIQLSPHQPVYLNSLGEAYRATGQLKEAVSCYTQALSYDYQYAEAHYNLANAQQTLGQIDAAIASYRHVIHLKPELAPAHHNLGVLLKQQGQLDAAIAAYRQALALQPNYPLALNSLGVLLGEMGQVNEAIQHLEQAIQLDPNLPEAHLNLGNLLKGQTQATKQGLTPIQRARQRYQQALQLKPDWAVAYFTLGNFYKDQGQTAIALEHYQKALQIQPNYPEAFWNQCLILPILYETPDEIATWRSRFQEGLQTLTESVRLNTQTEKQQALAGLSCMTNFFLQYQGLSDRPLQEQYGQLVQRVMQANYPQWSRPIQRRVTQRRIRVGFLSSFFREHTVGKLFLGWLQGLNRQDFDVYCYSTGQQHDDWTTEFRQASDHFTAIYNQFEATAHQIERDRLDVLILTDIGMNAESYKFAGLRLAPVQCVAWGHPITSGLPTVDYFLSSAEMEPPDAQADYSETLVQLPNIGISYARPTLPQTRKQREEFGLPPDAVLYLSCQSLYKYLPQYDAIFPEIAQQVPQSRFIFLASPTKGDFVTEQFKTRLGQVFHAYGLERDHYCVFLPRLDRTDYLQINLLSDIFLDTFAWSGGNTTLEAIACGLPIVTCPGEFMRGRHTYAMLNILGMTATIAQDQADYVDIAVRLGLDGNWRRETIARMQAQADQLFSDSACIRSLEEFLKNAVGLG